MMRLVWRLLRSSRVIVRWLVASALLVCALWVVVANWACVFKQRSWVPLVGGLLGCVGLLLLPVSGATYWWVPFAIDFGSAIGMTWTVAFHVRQRFSA